MSKRTGGRRIRWTILAFEDLRAARSYIGLRNRDAARRFAADVRKAVKHLKTHPEMGKVHEDLWPVGTYRYLVVSHYLIIYRLDGDDVIAVLRVWDGRQDPGRLLVE